MLFCCLKEATEMAHIMSRIKTSLRNVAVIAGGLAGAFAFFLFVLNIVLVLPLVCIILIAMGPS